MVAFTIPGPPVAKARARSSKETGKFYTPAKTRTYEKSVADYAWVAMRGQPMMLGPVKVTIAFHIKRPARKLALLPNCRPDLDNFMKSVFDGCNGIVFKDDSQICMITAHKFYSGTPRTVVSMSEILEVDTP